MVAQAAAQVMQNDADLATQLKATIKREGKRLEDFIGADIASVGEATRILVTKGLEDAKRQVHELGTVLEGKLDNNAEGISDVTKGQKHMNKRLKDMGDRVMKIEEQLGDLRDRYIPRSIFATRIDLQANVNPNPDPNATVLVLSTNK